MTANIPSGYQVTVHSSENDGDIPASASLYGLTKDDASFLNKVLIGLAMEGDNDFMAYRDVYHIVETAMECVDVSDRMRKELIHWSEEYSDDYVESDINSFLRELSLIGLDENAYDPNALYIRSIDDIQFFYLESPIVNVNHEFK